MHLRMLSATRVFKLFAMLVGIILPLHSVAEESAAELARAAQNPVASMISLPFQSNTNFNFGPEEETQQVLNIQLVWPITLNEDSPANRAAT